MNKHIYHYHHLYLLFEICYDQFFIFFSGNCWLEKYFRWCPYNELCNFIESLIKLISKLKLIGISKEWENVINTFIVPSIIQLPKRTDCPGQVAEIGAAIVSLDAARYKHVIEHLIAQDVNIEITEKFLRCLFEQSDFGLLVFHQKILIQVTFKS